MRKLKLLFAGFALLFGGISASAQTDVTSTYITNAGFDTESDFQTGNVATGGSNQRKAVTGWTNSGGNTYSTGAAIGFGTSGQINGANLPSTNADGGTTGGALCLNSAWESQAWYAQEITLPAGNYTFKFMVNNVGQNKEWNNDPPLFSFTTSLNTFAGNVNSYPVSTWTEQTISFALATETTGTVKIGYKANNTGSGNTPKLVVDYVKAFYNSNYTATLKSAIDRATRLYNRLNNSDLNSAISAAQSVLDGAGTDVAYQATIDAAVTTLRSAITTAQATFVAEGEEDITFLLENANFESSTAITGGICTYAYDCAKNGVFYSQMQQVEGWEVVDNANGKAAGVLAYGSSTWVAGSSYKASSVTSSIGENNALALVGAWSATVRYKQAVTLPAGVYVLTVPVFNSNGGTAISKNLIGFVTDGGTEYLATTTQYPVGSTKTETINFSLEEETTGYISLGYTAGNTGSGNCPKMFIDAITIKYFTADKSALFDKIAEAQTYQAVLNNSDLAAAITTAQGVYDNTSALQTAVDAQVTALETAMSNALQNIANGTDVTTLFIANSSFEEGGTGWNFNSASDTGVKENSNATYTTTGVDGSYLFNTWGGSDAKYVKQSLTGLPTGYYIVKALVASDYPGTVTLYAGEGTNDVDFDYDGKGLFISGVSGIAQPAEGALEIGATSTNWYKADKFQLFYYTTEENAQAVIDASNLTNAISNYDKALAAAKALSNDAITGKEKVDLDAAIDADDTLDKTSTSAVKTATGTLISTSTAFTAATSAYERAAYAITKATAASVDATSLSTLKTASTTVAADLTEPTNELLAAVINSYAPGVFGFQNGEYAPYNNTDGLTLLAVADEVASKTTDEITTTITGLQADNLWTVNDGDVDAIYNGNMAVTNDWNPKGWSRADNGWGQQITGLDTETQTTNGTAWYYNANSSSQYGNNGIYTMPLAANTYYDLTLSYRSQTDGLSSLKVSVLNNEEGLALTELGANTTTTFSRKSVRFQTGAAGNYILSIANTGNFYFTDVTLTKTTLFDIANALTAAKSDAKAALDNSDYENIKGSERAQLIVSWGKDPEAESISAYVALIEEINEKKATFTAAKTNYDDVATAVATAQAIVDEAVNVGSEAFQIPVSAQTTLSDAINDANNDVASEEMTAAGTSTLIETLNTAVTTYNSAELNAPADGTRYYIKVAKSGHAKENNAWTIALGETGTNNPTGYSINANYAPNPNLSQAFIFTKVSGNLYNISIERNEGTLYLTYGSLNGSAAGWKKMQIQATTDDTKKGEFKIIATSTEGKYNIFNTEQKDNIDCQSGGSIYTDTGITNDEFTMSLATQASVDVNINSTVQFATRIFPFTPILPDGIVAYSCSAIDENTLTLSKVDSPLANVPYLLYAESGYTDDALTGWGCGEVATYENGLLTGVYASTTAPVGSYVLQKKEDVVAFYKVAEGKQPNVGANRAYLTAPAEARALYFSFDDEATGIDAIKALTSGKTTIYNAAGAVVPSLQKGLNIIKMSDGSIRKVMVK